MNSNLITKILFENRNRKVFEVFHHFLKVPKFMSYNSGLIKKYVSITTEADDKIGDHCLDSNKRLFLQMQIINMKISGASLLFK